MEPISVVIPAFNEEKGVVFVIERIKHLPLCAEIIVVDDGSTDRTAAHAEAAGATVVRQPANGGCGLALKRGIQVAHHELIAITDADGTYPVDSLPSLVAKMGEGFDMMVGARQGRVYWGTFLKIPARIFFRFLVEFSTGKHIPDINSGLRVFRKSDVLPLFPILCNSFSFQTTLTLTYCFLHKFIGYVPITYGERIGTSKVRIVRDSLKTLQYIIETIAYFNPLKLFLLCTILLDVLGILLLWVSSVYGSGAALGGAVLFFLTSALVFAIGLHAEAVRRM